MPKIWGYVETTTILTSQNGESTAIKSQTSEPSAVRGSICGLHLAGLDWARPMDDRETPVGGKWPTRNPVLESGATGAPSQGWSKGGDKDHVGEKNHTGVVQQSSSFLACIAMYRRPFAVLSRLQKNTGFPFVHCDEVIPLH